MGCLAMATQYLKRYRMEFDFRQVRSERPQLPDGYRWRPWHPRLLSEHAAVKYASFRYELDSRMFLALSSLHGCESLMRGIVRHDGFLPQATWLIEYTGNDFIEPACVGTIQGLLHSSVQGSIQNVGIVPEHRGMGLGRAILLKALAGFRTYGLLRVSLDVTAENRPAVELYRSVGFQLASTSYRELPEPVGVA